MSKASAAASAVAVASIVTACASLVGCGGSVRAEEAATTSGGAGGGSTAEGSTGGSGGGRGGGGTCPIGSGHVLGGPGLKFSGSVAVDASGARVLSVSSDGSDAMPTPITLDGVTLASNGNVVVKLDAADELAWARPIHGGQLNWSYPIPVAIDGDGEVLVGGCFYGSVDVGDGVSTSTPSWAVVVAKLSAQGEPLWIRGFPGPTTGDCLSDLAVDRVGNVILAGRTDVGVDFGAGPLQGGGVYVAKLDPSGATLWARAYAGTGLFSSQTLAVTPSGGVAVATGLNNEVVVFSLDADGDYLFTKQYGHAQGQGATAMTVDTSGHIWVAGNFGGTIDFGGGPLTGSGNLFIAELDALGNHLHSRALSGDDAYVNAIAPLPSGGIAIGGSFDSTFDDGCGPMTAPLGADNPITSGTAAFVTWIDDTGACLLHHTLGPGSIGQGVTALAADAQGRIAAVGTFQGTIDLGQGPTTSSEDWRGFVVDLCSP
jgi:hypothetical protein